MATPETGTHSRTDRFLDFIQQLRDGDVLRAKQQGLPKELYLDRALPFAVVLSAAALRGKGVSVLQSTERRVVGALGIGFQSWKSATLKTQEDLGAEAITGSGTEHMSVVLGEEALKAIQAKPFVGYMTLRNMVELAVDQERGLLAQAHIAMDNISVEMQL